MWLPCAHFGCCVLKMLSHTARTELKYNADDDEEIKAYLE